jgi:hypothetical protein
MVKVGRAGPSAIQKRGIMLEVTSFSFDVVIKEE